MRRVLFALILATLPPTSRAADPPAVAGDRWTDLLKAGAASPWKTVDAKWIFAGDATLNPDRPTRLKAVPGSGSVWVNGETGHVADLVTRQTFKDVEVHVEFLIAKKSNSGIKFHAVYEIQILDSAGRKDGELSGDDCGGIYPRAELKPVYRYLDKGIPPRVNAAKPAGEWQTLDVIFRSPRFGATGEKTENARIVKALLNGRMIHENQELKTPTGNNWSVPETPTGPFMLQADHGPVAFRNVRIREIGAK